MVTNTEPLTDTALLQLMTWLSPAFPVGGYVYSHGIEFAVEGGRVTDEATLTRWIDAILCHGAGRIDSVFFVQAWQAVMNGGDLALFELVERGDAMRGTSELALEGTAQGEAFIQTVSQTWRSNDLENIIKKLAEINRPLTYPIAVAIVAAAAAIPLRPALLVYSQAFVANLISAGVRLVPLGQIAGQRTTESLKPTILRSVEEALNADMNDLGTAAPLIDWTSIKHETQYSRLFRS